MTHRAQRFSKLQGGMTPNPKGGASRLASRGMTYRGANLPVLFEIYDANRSVTLASRMTYRGAHTLGVGHGVTSSRGGYLNDVHLVDSNPRKRGGTHVAGSATASIVPFRSTHARRVRKGIGSAAAFVPTVTVVVTDARLKPVNIAPPRRTVHQETTAWCEVPSRPSPPAETESLDRLAAN